MRRGLSCARRSATRSIRTFTQPGRRLLGIRQRSWDFDCPSQCSLLPRVLVFVTTPCDLLVLSGVSPPFIPTCRYQPRSAYR